MVLICLPREPSTCYNDFTLVEKHIDNHCRSLSLGGLTSRARQTDWLAGLITLHPWLNICLQFVMSCTSFLRPCLFFFFLVIWWHFQQLSLKVADGTMDAGVVLEPQGRIVVGVFESRCGLAVRSMAMVIDVFGEVNNGDQHFPTHSKRC